VLVAFISWFQMRLEENERLEKLELDELARSRGASLFESKDGGSFPAQNARLQFEKYFVPGFAVLMLLLEAGGAWLLWNWSGKNAANLREGEATVALSLFAIFALLLFLIGRFSVTIARLENHRLLRPGASFLLAGAYVCAFTALGIAGVEAKFPKADFWVARGLCVLLGLMAVENLLTLLLEIYRPRVKARSPGRSTKAASSAFSRSRKACSLRRRRRWITSSASRFRKRGFFQAAQKNLAALLLIQFAVLLLSTTVVFVGVGEQAVREHFGKPQATLGPGAHLKWPWPADKFTAFAPSKFSPSPSATRRTHRPKRQTRCFGRSATTRRKTSSLPTAPPRRPVPPRTTRPKRRPSASSPSAFRCSSKSRTSRPGSIATASRMCCCRIWPHAKSFIISPVWT